MSRSPCILLLFLVTGALSQDVVKKIDYVAIANRVSGTVSIVDFDLLTDVTTLTLPAGGEPTYNAISGNRLFVADRGNSQIHVYNTFTWDFLKSIDVGDGTFHAMGTCDDPTTINSKGGAGDVADRTLLQSFDRRNGTWQIWVTCDISKETYVIDPFQLRVIGVIPMPADILQNFGGKPHDCTASHKFGYVSYITETEGVGFVVQYSSETFQEMSRLQLGGDPHLCQWDKSHLFVASQGSNEVLIVNKFSLVVIRRVSVPNAHGTWLSKDKTHFWTTNIADGGAGGLVTLDGRTGNVLDAQDLPFGTPHNLCTDGINTHMFVTHSIADKNITSIWELNDDGTPNGSYQTIETGFNPFGITYIYTKDPDQS